MRILLISPPFKRFTGLLTFYYPIGLGYIGSALRREGYEVRILDVDVLEKTQSLDFSNERDMMKGYIEGVNNLSHPVWKDVRKALQDFDPDVVGINAMTMYFASALNVARLAKEYNKDCPVIMGGPHPTLEPEQTLASEYVDFVCIGEAEESILELVKAIGQKDNDFNSISGLGYKKDGKIVINNGWRLISKLDTVPLPGRELLVAKENYTPEDMGVIMSSRGCPFRCGFCSHIVRTRYHSVDRVMEEIQTCIEKYGVKQFSFKDDSFTVNRKRTIELCQKIIDEGININWECTTRVDLIDNELLGIMKRAGCNGLKIGVETGSPEIMKAIQKGITLEQVKNAARLLNKHGIFWTAYFMMGLPMEKEEYIFATYHFMREISPPYASIGVYKQLPKTAIYNTGIELGIVHQKVDIEHFYQTNPVDYYYKNPDKRMYYIENERFEEISAEIMKAFHRHNTSFRRMAGRAWSRRRLYWRDRSLLFSDLNKALQWVGLKS